MDLRSDPGAHRGSSEQYTWESSLHVGIPVSQLHEILRQQLDLVNPQTPALSHMETNCTVVEFDDQENFGDWLEQFHDILEQEVAMKKHILAFEFTGEDVPLFLLAINAILRSCIMGHSVSVRLAAKNAGVPGTCGSLRTHLVHILKNCSETVNVYEVNTLYQKTLSKFI